MTVSASVGKGGVNRQADTRIVQGLLNPHVARLGVRPLAIDGICGPLTIGAITRYQSNVMRVTADGRIDVGGPTLASLTKAAGPGGGTLGTITVVRRPQLLTWQYFTQVPVVIDPADNTRQQAYTQFDYDVPDIPHRVVDGKFAFGVPNVITITPRAFLQIGVPMKAALLEHERFHYDVGYICARRFAADMLATRTATLDELKAAYITLLDLHFYDRAEAIQARYDKNTKHGADPAFQALWLLLMHTCTGNPGATHIGDMPL
jgi:hypothetical protein